MVNWEIKSSDKANQLIYASQMESTVKMMQRQLSV